MSNKISIPQTLFEDIINGGKGFPAIDKVFDELLAYARTVDKIDANNRTANMILSKVQNTINKEFRKTFNAEFRLDFADPKYGIGGVATVIPQYTINDLKDIREEYQRNPTIIVSPKGYKFGITTLVKSTLYLGAVSAIANVRPEDIDPANRQFLTGRFFTAIILHELGHILADYRTLLYSGADINIQPDYETGNKPRNYLVDPEKTNQSVLGADLANVRAAAGVTGLISMVGIFATASTPGLALAGFFLMALASYRAGSVLLDTDDYYQNERTADSMAIQYGYAYENIAFLDWISHQNTLRTKTKNPFKILYRKISTSIMGSNFGYDKQVKFVSNGLIQILRMELKNPNNTPKMKKDIQAQIKAVKALKVPKDLKPTVARANTRRK